MCQPWNVNTTRQSYKEAGIFILIFKLICDINLSETLIELIAKIASHLIRGKFDLF